MTRRIVFTRAGGLLERALGYGVITYREDLAMAEGFVHVVEESGSWSVRIEGSHGHAGAIRERRSFAGDPRRRRG